VIPLFRSFVAPDEPRFRAPRFERFAGDLALWRSVGVLILSTAAFFVFLALVSALRKYFL
jgi:hypothetical protein